MEASAGKRLARVEVMGSETDNETIVLIVAKASGHFVAPAFGQRCCVFAWNSKGYWHERRFAAGSCHDSPSPAESPRVAEARDELVADEEDRHVCSSVVLHLRSYLNSRL